MSGRRGDSYPDSYPDPDPDPDPDLCPNFGRGWPLPRGAASDAVDAVDPSHRRRCQGLERRGTGETNRGLCRPCHRTRVPGGFARNDAWALGRHVESAEEGVRERAHDDGRTCDGAHVALAQQRQRRQQHGEEEEEEEGEQEGEQEEQEGEGGSPVSVGQQQRLGSASLVESLVESLVASLLANLWANLWANGRRGHGETSGNPAVAEATAPEMVAGWDIDGCGKALPGRSLAKARDGCRAQTCGRRTRGMEAGGSCQIWSGATAEKHLEMPRRLDDGRNG
ncbi:hypothetical protein Trco_003422 [Trichoderma cornu-damae]|uniref:Uncharacterized protein n=1 Tax=Trichoderma cornu-damae TaxID=654480 RepID=A0A9P8QL10_9HYPO|nr:hypothetical protein Trco_003422 [Trichoderma cornu-damae]